MVKGRRKGREGENEFARLTGGKRVSEAGLGGADVEAYGRLWEVKRWKDGITALLRALDQAKRNGGHLLAVRQDRSKWIVVMYLDDFHDKYIKEQ